MIAKRSAHAFFLFIATAVIILRLHAQREPVQDLQYACTPQPLLL